jgi:hypothetical protein
MELIQQPAISTVQAANEAVILTWPFGSSIVEQTLTLGVI